jgi:hypothetical protein
MTVVRMGDLPYSDRTLNGRTDEQGWQPGWSDAVVEAIQAINELTAAKERLPMPAIHSLLGNLKQVGYELPQALHQLTRSLATEGIGPVMVSNRSDRKDAAAEARDHLAHAARRASELGALLEAAQLAIGESRPRDSGVTESK